MENLEQPATSAVAADDAPAALPQPSSDRSNSTSSSSSESSSSDSTSQADGNGDGQLQGEDGGTNGRSSSAEYPALMPPPPPAVNTLCRICMCDPAADGRMLESLFRTTVDSKTLYAMLVTVVPLGHGNNDGMPDKVCTSCKAKLVQAYRLYETCIKSDERLRKLLQLQNSAGGVLIKQEIIDEDDEDAELANFQLYCDAQVKKEDEYDQDYLFDGGFYGVGLAAAHYNTPNLRIQSVHNGPEVLVQLQEGNDSPTKPAVEWDKYVKVTPNGHHCILCGKDFKYFSYFKQHAIAQHDPTKPHKCQQCKYTFKTEQRLFLHMRTHLEQAAEEPPLAVEHAELPDTELEIEGSLDLDQSDDQIVDDDSVAVSINPDNGEKIYTCLICQKQLTTLPLYRRHQTVHTVRGRPFECEICHYRFAMKFSYNAHMLRHEQGKDPATPAAYKCAECPETFVRRKLLNLHVAVNHEKPTVYLNRTAPAAILTSNISEGRGGHACPICSETFNRESVLNNHMKTHELEAAQLKHSEICYICNVCGVECETRDSFTSHIKTHGDDIALEHQQNNSMMDVDDDDVDPLPPPNQNGADPLSTSTPSKPEPKSGIRCELCSKTFPYACNLKQHRIIHHSELKPHECHVCHYRFEYEGTLMRHMQKHSKQELSAAAALPQTPTQHPGPAAATAPEDPIVAPPGSSIVYKCKLCSARFQKQKSMTWHLKTHRSIVAAGEDKEQSPTKELGSPLSPNSAATASTNAFAARLDLKPQTSSSSSSSSSSTAMQQIQQLQQAAMRGAAAGGAAKMYKCGYCPQKLDSEDAYYQHLKGHRVRPAADPLQPDEDTPPVKKKRSWVRSGEHHKCHLCQKVFTFRSQLQQHTALHHQPGKPYECGKCHYSFVHKLNLKRHELTHLEEERVSAEDDPSIQLLEDESFNADGTEECAEPDEMSPAVVGLMPVNRSGGGGDAGEKQSGEAGGPPKKNKCVVCAASFQREDQLIEHLKTHIERMKVTKQETQSAKKALTDDSDKKCKLCAKVFKFSCQLKQHIQMHHSKDKPFECNICRYRFEFKGHMLRHKANNHPDELAAEEADADELPAKITTPTVNPDGSEVYQCPVCPMNFVKQRSLTWHLKTHTGGTARKIKREDGTGYPSASSSSTGEVFQCRVCTRLFNDAYELKAHMLTHAGSSSSSGQVVEADHSLFGSGLDMMLQDFPDTMEDTDPLFDGSNLELVLEDNFDHDLDFSLRYNQQQDASSLPQTRRSLPTTGGGNDSSVYDMAEPGASTTPAKGKIVCELCKKDFLYSCNLKQHMQLHHAKEKPFECKICFYRFEYSGHLVRHIRTNHDNQQEDAIGDAIERNFVCTFCSELFEQKSQLNSHIQTYHRGEKQFKCDMCPASFAYKKTFENHREEHHSIKPGEPSTAPMMMPVAVIAPPPPSAPGGSASFSCNLCKKSFSSAQKVDNHVCFQ